MNGALSHVHLDVEAAADLGDIRSGLRGLATLLESTDDLPPGFQLAVLIGALADRIDPIIGALEDLGPPAND